MTCGTSKYSLLYLLVSTYRQSFQPIRGSSPKISPIDRSSTLTAPSFWLAIYSNISDSVLNTFLSSMASFRPPRCGRYIIIAPCLSLIHNKFCDLWRICSSCDLNFTYTFILCIILICYSAFCF